MTFKFNKEYYIDSVLLVQDVLGGFLGIVSIDTLDTSYATQWDIFIGNDPDWRNNAKCTLTPRLAADYNDRVKDWSAGGTEGKEVPDYGFVEFCNMTGEYVTFVARGVPSANLSLCTVGIFGNSFVRDISPETTVEIPAGERHTLKVEHIKAEHAQSNNPTINLRQKDDQELPSVSFKNGSTSTDVIIDTAGLSLG